MSTKYKQAEASKGKMNWEASLLLCHVSLSLPENVALRDREGQDWTRLVALQTAYFVHFLH